MKTPSINSTWTPLHALRFVDFGDHHGGICACGWQTARWHDTDREVVAEFDNHRGECK